MKKKEEGFVRAVIPFWWIQMWEKHPSACDSVGGCAEDQCVLAEVTDRDAPVWTAGLQLSSSLLA